MKVGRREKKLKNGELKSSQHRRKGKRTDTTGQREEMEQKPIIDIRWVPKEGKA